MYALVLLDAVIISLDFNLFCALHDDNRANEKNKRINNVFLNTNLKGISS